MERKFLSSPDRKLWSSPAITTLNATPPVVCVCWNSSAWPKRAVTHEMLEADLVMAPRSVHCGRARKVIVSGYHGVNPRSLTLLVSFGCRLHRAMLKATR